MIGRAEIINNLYVLKQDPSKIDCKHYVSLAAKCPDVNSLNKSDFFDTWQFGWATHLLLFYNMYPMFFHM